MSVTEVKHERPIPRSTAPWGVAMIRGSGRATPRHAEVADIARTLQAQATHIDREMACWPREHRKTSDADGIFELPHCQRAGWCCGRLLSSEEGFVGRECVRKGSS